MIQTHAAACDTGASKGAIPISDDERARLERMLVHERAAAASGFTRIAGVDEAGRGPLAGPIVAAAAILNWAVPGLNDSKQLSEAQREDLYARLRDEGHAIAVAVVPHTDIDRLGIQNANYRAMLFAVEQLRMKPDFLLVDGFAIPGCPLPHKRLVKGDCVSLSIAAASIAAKVERDRIMKALHEQFPEYGFDRHKGYATRDHLDAIRQFGPCTVHRMSFAPLCSSHEAGDLFDTVRQAHEGV